MRKFLSKETNWIKLIILGVILVNIKRMFVDFDTDYEYAIVQAYRMARGDRMIAQMWEPHQTSAFLNAVFIKLYLAVTGTTTGIALYLNLAGLGVKAGVAYAVYRTFRECCNRSILFFMCAFFMTVNAKNFIVPDYSNMMIYFSVLLCCCLFAYFQRVQAGKKGKCFLVFAAVCFCLEAVSYPSAVILFPLILAMLYCYSWTKGKDMALFSGICFTAGVAYFAFLVRETGWERFWVSARYIITGDDSHSMTKFAGRLAGYIAEIGSLAVLFCACGLVAFVIGRRRICQSRTLIGAQEMCRQGSPQAARRAGSIHLSYPVVEIFLAVLLVYNFVQIALDVTETGLPIVFRFLYVAVYIPLLCLAFVVKKHCSDGVKMAFHIGAAISIGSGVSVLLLTNLPLLTILAYLILGVMVSMMPIGEYLQKIMPEKKWIRVYGILVLFLFVTMFKNVYVIKSANRTNASILSIRNVIRGGPMAGLFSDYMGAYVRNSDLQDWGQYVREGDKVLIVSLPLAGTIGYLYEDVEICVDSTICTPTYNEKLLAYWELNPWKEPNVIVMECWYGKPHVEADTWIMGWIEENFDSYADGKYVRVYRREL